MWLFIAMIIHIAAYVKSTFSPEYVLYLQRDHSGSAAARCEPYAQPGGWVERVFLCLWKRNPRPRLDIVFPCPKIILPGCYFKHDNRRTVWCPRSYILQPRHCLIKLPADIHILHDFNLTGHTQDHANIRRRSRLVKSNLDFRIRPKLKHQWFHLGRIEVKARCICIPCGHRTHARPISIYRGEKAIGVSPNKFNAVIKSHLLLPQPNAAAGWTARSAGTASGWENAAPLARRAASAPTSGISRTADHAFRAKRANPYSPASAPSFCSP